MLLDEMGIIGHQVKISDQSPVYPNQIGTIVTMSTDRLYVKFPDGKKEWIANKYIVGTKRQDVDERSDFEEFPLTEMAAKKQCEKCGKTMAANHYWYKGGWKCKKSGDGAAAPAAAARSEVKKDTDPFPEMSDEAYDKLSRQQQAAQDAKEKAWFERHGRTGPRDYVPKDAHEAAQHKRAEQFRDEVMKSAKHMKKK